MTDRVKGFTVTLKDDIRDDDFKAIGDAVAMIKGVAHVEPSIRTSDDFMNRQRIAMEYERAFWDLFKDLRKGKKD